MGGHSTRSSRRSGVLRAGEILAGGKSSSASDIAAENRGVSNVAAPRVNLTLQQMALSGRRVSPVGIVVRPIAAFFRNYVLRNGWRDGSAGLVVSILNSYYVFLKFAKLWEMNRGGQNASSRGER